MTAAELKKLQVSKVDMDKIAEWQFDNKDYGEIFMSLTFLHNETCNVYSHLTGALFLPFIAVCLILNVLYHLMLSHSHIVEQFWPAMDLLGITIVVVGTFTAGSYYVFYCEPALRKAHWGINWTMATVTGILASNPSLRTPRGRRAKVAAFILFGATSFIHLLRGAQRYGLDYMMQSASMYWYFLEILVYGSSILLYAFRIPERLSPGTFDIWGSSHQIFHVAILCGMWAHASGLVKGFTSFHTMGLCRP
ncbi:mPR-like GPCR protein [Xylariaceae sp. FL1272]|nr:mPR-like GPCR protein [Xylariaceae sp. FL1272]